MRLSLDLSLTSILNLNKGGGGGSWWTSSAFDADYANSRFIFDGQAYDNEAAFNTAAGISVSGIARTVGPFDISGNLLTNGDPVADLTGWTAQNSALLSAVDGELVLDGNGGNNPTGYHAVTTELSHAYRYGGTYRRGTTGSGVIVLATIANPSTANGATVTNNTSSDVTGDNTFGAEGTTSNIGLRIGANGATGTAICGPFFCYECIPFDGFTPASLAARIAFTTPASLAGDQAVFEGCGNSKSATVRNKITANLRASDNHLIVTVTFGNSAAASLDMGVVSLGASHVLEISNATNRFMARLDDGGIVGDTVGTMPGIGIIYIGRSSTGQTWTGTIERVTVWAGEHVPTNAISMEGDSYPAGANGVSGAGSLSTILGKPVFVTASGGSTLAQQVARVQANPELYRGVFVHIDGDNNGYGSLETDMGLYADMIEAIGHNRFIIVPPMQRANKTTEANAATLALSNALLAAYPNNTVDGQALLAAHATSPGDDAAVAAGQIPPSLLQVDETHLTSDGMNYLMQGPADIITDRGW
ncbi:hypothetical protein SAMN02982989_3440 [Xaviernesmea oryzae]|uniref:Uncharacterized protein n=1 Tax=Xaviernesmea oryzae TaxID=464029 RepID=A0A1X7G922_9HYPH|nr:hypothetical protein [Xaviernesmea oryzae]SMF66131.1 hypothetical protein SAMN02982989_3440 [Xaviernesmea oryzae]